MFLDLQNVSQRKSHYSEDQGAIPVLIVPKNFFFGNLHLLDINITKESEHLPQACLFQILNTQWCRSEHIYLFIITKPGFMNPCPS
jgi:hypothetical protein